MKEITEKVEKAIYLLEGVKNGAIHGDIKWAGDFCWQAHKAIVELGDIIRGTSVEYEDRNG